MGDMYNAAGREVTRKVVETTVTVSPDGTQTFKKTETTETVPGTQKRLPTTTETAPNENILALPWK